MNKSNQNEGPCILIVCSPETKEFLTSQVRKVFPDSQIHTMQLVGLVRGLTALKPSLVLVATTPTTNSDLLLLRTSMIRARTRSPAPHFSLVLVNPEQLGRAGSLLVASANQDPSERFDSCLVLPIIPGHSLDSFAEQLRDLSKYANGATYPKLGDEAWVESVADFSSRTLWYSWIPRYARYVQETPVIVGESGTGKTRVANALHQLSGRNGKFVTITPRDFSSSELIQTELFGSVPGAYTGAVDRWGLVKSAEGGTLFIDELQSIDRDLQGKIITFIENKRYRRVGASESIQADVRLVFATNRSLAELRDQGVLREDFTYRLERVQLELLPLRKRPLDIVVGVAFGIARVMNQRLYSRPIVGISPSALHYLMQLSWPGNSRQLENTVARLCDLADLAGSSIITIEMVHEVSSALSSTSVNFSIFRTIQEVLPQIDQSNINEEAISLNSVLSEITRLARLRALEYTNGNPSEASNLLGESAELVSLYYDHSRSVEVER